MPEQGDSALAGENDGVVRARTRHGHRLRRVQILADADMAASPSHYLGRTYMIQRSGVLKAPCLDLIGSQSGYQPSETPVHPKISVKSPITVSNGHKKLITFCL